MGLYCEECDEFYEYTDRYRHEREKHKHNKNSKKRKERNKEIDLNIMESINYRIFK